MNTLRPEAPTPEIQAELQRLMQTAELLVAAHVELAAKLQPVLAPVVDGKTLASCVEEIRPSTPLGEFVRRIDDMLQAELRGTRELTHSIAF